MSLLPHRRIPSPAGGAGNIQRSLHYRYHNPKHRETYGILTER